MRLNGVRICFEKLDRRFAQLEQNDQLLDGLDQFGEQAYSMITSSRAREAFDISKEPESFARQFGEESFGQSCMLALRLVESGVRLVSVQLGGWDTHTDNFTKLKTNNLPKLDAGLSGLLIGLEQRGLLDSTAVFVTGEFGRTPKINSRSAEGGPRSLSSLHVHADGRRWRSWRPGHRRKR